MLKTGKTPLFIHPDDLELCSCDLVLPRYQGMVTGDEDSPKLFDERRTSRAEVSGAGYVMMVDDEEFILTAAQEMLSDSGYKVTAAAAALKR